MANFCLPKISTDKFLKALADGTITPEKMADMSSAERREVFTKLVGEDQAKDVNALLESKLLLKDQQTGLINWAERVSGLSEETRRDIISRIERMTNVLQPGEEEQFLADLAAKRLGTEVTREEAANVTKGVKAVQDAKSKWDSKKAEADLAKDPTNKNAGWTNEDDRLKYGLQLEGFQKYIQDLKLKNKEGGFLHTLKHPGEWYSAVAGTTKSILSSFDNSYFGRQGIKTLYTNPGIWGNAFLKSWGDIGKEVFGKGNLSHGIDATQTIKADIFSRPNALNGKYKAMGVDLGLDSEEAFPSTLQEKIPVLGRLFRASEAAYNGAALRMRADLADKLINQAEKFGVNMKDKKEAAPVGDLINSLTGRGKVALPDSGPLSAKNVNNTFFSIKYLKSNFDVLLNGLRSPAEMALDKITGKTRTPSEIFVRRKAATNLLKITAATAGILYTANKLWPGSVNFDPRSTNFGKIKIDNHTIDITGGLGSIATLAARITPTEHNGKWGLWSQNQKGIWSQLNDPKYGAQDGLDVINSFFEGKLSPIAGAARDVLTGQDYNGDKIGINTNSAKIEAENLLTPLPIGDYTQLQEPNKGTAFGLMLLDEVGLSPTTITTPKKK